MDGGREGVLHCSPIFLPGPRLEAQSPRNKLFDPLMGRGAAIRLERGRGLGILWGGSNPGLSESTNSPGPDPPLPYIPGISFTNTPSPANTPFPTKSGQGG